MVKKLLLSMAIGLFCFSAVPQVSIQAASKKSYKITDEEFNPYYEYVFVLDRQKEISGVEEMIKADLDKLEKDKIKKMRKIVSAKSISDFHRLENDYEQASKKLKERNKSLKQNEKAISEIEKSEKEIDKLIKKFTSESDDAKLKALHDELKTMIDNLNKKIDQLEKDKEYKKYLKKYNEKQKEEQKKELDKLSK